LEATDRPAVDRILDELTNQDGGFQDLIRLIVQSKTFGRN